VRSFKHRIAALTDGEPVVVDTGRRGPASGPALVAELRRRGAPGSARR
jgi:hypothetical protein